MKLLAQDVNLNLPTGSFGASTSSFTIGQILRTAIQIIFIVAGIAAFFYLLIGGVQWLMAGGDKEGTEKARKKITAALIGLAIVFSVYALVAIINTVFGISILGFNIPSINGA